MRRKDEDRLRLARLEEAVEGIQHSLDRVQLMFLMKDPSVPAGADAYEGLRRSLILAREDRMARLVDLARIDASLHRADGAGDVAAIVDELLVAAGVERVDHPTSGTDGLFDVFGEAGPGTREVVLEAAYVHAESGAVVRTGRVRHEPRTGTAGSSESRGGRPTGAEDDDGFRTDDSEHSVGQDAEGGSDGPDGGSDGGSDGASGRGTAQ